MTHHVPLLLPRDWSFSQKARYINHLTRVEILLVEQSVVIHEPWLEFMRTRGEELVRRLVATPTLPLPAAARHYLGANLYAAQLQRPIGSPKAGGPSRVDPLFGIGVPWVLGPDPGASDLRGSPIAASPNPRTPEMLDAARSACTPVITAATIHRISDERDSVPLLARGAQGVARGQS